MNALLDTDKTPENTPGPMVTGRLVRAVSKYWVDAFKEGKGIFPLGTDASVTYTFPPTYKFEPKVVEDAFIPQSGVEKFATFV